ncbi:MAG: PilT protein domain protein [Bryobacterales bacterium]|nr:PilT protein domain protein [Bryobacterales bacterium]
MKYLLDTDICIYIAKQKPAHILARFDRMHPGDVGMSVVTYLELMYGAAKSRQVQANLATIEQLAHLIPVQPLDTAAGTHYGKLRADLELRGSPIGAYDLLIAAHALTLE